MRSVRSRFLVLLAAAFVLSCGGNDDDKPTGPDPDAPFPYAAPPVGSMEMNLNDLGEGATQTDVGVCHALSAAAVLWIDVNVKVRLAVPVAAFAECLKQQSVYLGDSTWRWTAGAGAGADAWTAELTAHVVSESRVEWAMRISGTRQAFDRFLWVDGNCNGAARTGTWHYYDPASPQTTRELIRCDWALPATPGGNSAVLFQNVEAGGQDSGDRLRYEVTDSIALVSFYNSGPPADSVRVSWDLRTGEGMAIGAQADTCCWGPRPIYPDVICP